MLDENQISSEMKRGRGVTSQRVRLRLVESLIEQGITNKLVLTAIEDTPRHLFIDQTLASRAYENTALPIGFGQTISQPYIVAKMISLILDNNPRPLERVLDVGTGCGYQAAVLSKLVKQVYGIERISQLANIARLRLHHLGYMNVRIRHADGFQGLEYYAPYQAILLAAASIEIPKILLDQLDIGGRLVAPVGNTSQQKLMLIERNSRGFTESEIEMVNFVPLLPGLE